MNEPAPAYLKLKRYLLQHIVNGDYPPQSRLPSEKDLVMKFGVSRMTVNRAMRELTSAGVITRVQGVGSFVADPKVESALLDVRSIRSEIAARGETHSVDVLVSESVAASPSMARQFGITSGDPLFHSRLLHRADGKPLQLEDRFVSPACAPGYLDIDFQLEIPHHYLMRTAPLQRTEHVIEAEAANRRLAKWLDVSVGAPLLVLGRRTWSRDRVASVARLTHPAAKYRFVGSFHVGEALHA
jgi:GntR family histidine utilization transcriptional repressor